jgi:hypothetical protein
LNNELSPAQKKLLLNQSRLESYRVVFGMVLLFLLAGLIGVACGGWVRIVAEVVVVGGSIVTYTLLEEGEKRLQAELEDEQEKQREAKRQARKRKNST